MADIVARFMPRPQALLKGGVGEAVTLVPFLEAFPEKISVRYGFDISWSRLQYARQFLEAHEYGKTQLCVGSLQEMPFVDEAFDLIMTSHALEPNGGDELQIMRELFRVSAHTVALFEPSYAFADTVGKQRITEKGYVKHLDQVAREAGFKVLYHQPLSAAMNPQNPTAALVLQKPTVRTATLPEQKYACPRAKTMLASQEEGYFSEDSFLFYPVVKNVPILRADHALLASAMYTSQRE